VVSRDPDSEDSDLESLQDSVATAQRVKKAIDAHKKRRFGVRQQIHAQYAKRAAEIRKRAEERLAECRKRCAKAHMERLDRLLKAVEARQSKQRAIAEKLRRLHNDSCTLAAQLVAICEGRAEKARSASVQQLMVQDKGTGPAI